MTGTKLVTAALAVMFGVALAAAGLEAKPKGSKSTPAHDAAVQRCTDAYEATVAAAHAPKAPTGKVRKQTMHAAAEA